MKQQRMTFNSISLQGAVRQVLKNWWVVLFFALSVLLGATGFGQLTYIPQYTSSSTLVIHVKGADAYSTLAQTTQMTAVYSEVFQSTALRNMISQSLGEEVIGTISCSQIAETNLLVLKAISPTPRQAYLLIHAALDNYEQVAGYVFTNAALEIVQEPSVPESPSNTSFLVSNCFALAAVAAIATIGLIVLIYLVRNTLKVASKASIFLDGTVLGTVPYEKKRSLGKKKWYSSKKKKSVPALLLSSPLVSMNFVEASRRVATRLEAHLQRKKYQVLLVASVEENEGKSTVAANIAIALAERGRRVLLIDGDFRKPAQWRIFDKENLKQSSFSDVILGKDVWENAIVANERNGILEMFQYKALKNPGSLLNSQRISALLSEFREEMDYIIVDCSPVAAAADAELWMHHVDSVVLVVRQDVSDVRIINDTVDMIWKSAGDFSGFVLNAFQDEMLHAKHNGRYGAY